MVSKLIVLQLACLLAVAISFVSADEPERIVGASNASPGEFPYTVSLRMRGSHFCGGAIISNYHIITAAHCLLPVLQNPFAKVTVVTGTNSLLSGGESHKIDRLIVHPEYEKYNLWYSDVGIIKLASPITFNRFQNKINLPTANPPSNINAVVSAWGRTSQTGNLSYDLQKLYLRTIHPDTCQSYHSVDIYDIMICTYNRAGEGTCSGDSGSPLAYKNEIIGVVSGGIPCARGIPDIFTNIYKLLPFVERSLTY